MYSRKKRKEKYMYKKEKKVQGVRKENFYYKLLKFCSSDPEAWNGVMGHFADHHRFFVADTLYKEIRSPLSTYHTILSLASVKWLTIWQKIR